MAQIYQPRQRASDGRWDMTVSSDEEGWAHAEGYCGGLPKMYDESARARLGDTVFEMANRQAAEIAAGPHAGKYHRDGHSTAEEAEACYATFCLDKLKIHRFTGDRPAKLHACAHPGCAEYTPHMIEVGHFFHVHLCEAHLNRASVEPLYRARR